MKALIIRLAADDRRCNVDTIELNAWARTLVDDLLLEAAIAAGDRGAPDAKALAVTVQFTVDVDAEGSIIITR